MKFFSYREKYKKHISDKDHRCYVCLRMLEVEVNIFEKDICEKLICEPSR